MKAKLKLLFIALLAISATGLFISFKTTAIDGKDLKGAWEYGPVNNHTVMINTDKVFSVATYDLPGKKFISSYGGTWRVDGNRLIQKIEWNSKEPEQVGKEIATDATLAGSKLTVAQTKETWSKVVETQANDLTGAWIITGN